MSIPADKMWDKVAKENSHKNIPLDYASRPDLNTYSNLKEFLDKDVSADDVIDVEKVVGEILSHPHRKHFGTLDVPTAQDKKEYEKIFGMGIPTNVLYPFGHWYRMSQPLEKLRERYLTCKANAPEKASPKECMEEATEMYDTYLQLSEVPFRKCPETSSTYTYCVETMGAAKHPYGSRSLHQFIRFCKPEQLAWEECMGKAFGVKFPPTPKKFEYYPRSGRFTNLPWDEIYCYEVDAWLQEQQRAQAARVPTDAPVLTAADISQKSEELEKHALELLPPPRKAAAAAPTEAQEKCTDCDEMSGVSEGKWLDGSYFCAECKVKWEPQASPDTMSAEDGPADKTEEGLKRPADGPESEAKRAREDEPAEPEGASILEVD